MAARRGCSAAAERRVGARPARPRVALRGDRRRGLRPRRLRRLRRRPERAANLTPTVVYVLFWVGIPFPRCCSATSSGAFNPWRAIARARWIFGRRGAGRDAEPLAYPEWLGRWPAALGILAFAWVELVYVNRDDPSQLATMALAYAAVQLVGMSLYGIEPWSRNADAFGVYFGLFSMLSPLHWRDARAVRAPAARRRAQARCRLRDRRAVVHHDRHDVSFDGLSQGALWTGTSGIAPRLQQRFINLGFSGEVRSRSPSPSACSSWSASSRGVYRLGVIGMRSIRVGHTTTELSRRFVHSLIPISLAYVIAHYFSLLTYQGQAMAYLVSDPLGHGANLFGTATATINYNVIGANGVWYVQVFALVFGHVCGLTLAHDRALVVYTRVRDATRSQYWMLAVMVAFTCLGLWLLSAAAQ